MFTCLKKDLMTKKYHKINENDAIMLTVCNLATLG